MADLTLVLAPALNQYVLDVSGGNPRKFRFLVAAPLVTGYQAISQVNPYDSYIQPTWRHVVWRLRSANADR